MGYYLNNGLRCRLKGSLLCLLPLALIMFYTSSINPLSLVPVPLQVRAGCPALCECPAGRPSCPPGVSMVPDGCSCCKVCAAQLNQDCHAMQPCDHHKGLECNYGNDVGSTHGICRGELSTRRGQDRVYFAGALRTATGRILASALMGLHLVPGSVLI